MLQTIHLPRMTFRVQHLLKQAVRAADQGIEKLGNMADEIHAAKQHLGNAGRALTGKKMKNGGYSLENALEFSQQQAAAHGWSGYGDPEYVPHVQRYYSGGNIFAGLFGNQQIVTVAQNEIGASDGQKYWS